MTGSSSAGSLGATKKCIRCKQNAPSALDCVKCGATIHKGCIKLMKTARLLNDVDVVCCEGVNTPDNPKFDEAKVDLAVENVEEGASDALIVEIKYLKKLIEQKDVVIDTQKEAINALKDQVKLLKSERTRKSPGAPSAVRGADVNNGAALHDGKVVDRVGAGDGLCSGAGGVEDSGMPAITREKVSAGLHIAGARAVLSKYVNLVGDEGKPDVSGDVRKRPGHHRNRPIVGTKEVVLGSDGNAGTVRAAMEYSPIHVYKLHVKTTTQDLVDYLKPNFPEVKVEMLKSAHPDWYSSFKITVLKHNEAKAMDPDLWPVGVRLSRFFIFRRREEQEK